MFHIDATFEDLRLITSKNGNSEGWMLKLADNATGEEWSGVITDQQLDDILAFNLHINGMPITSTIDERYARLDELVKRIPEALRPIP